MEKFEPGRPETRALHGFPLEAVVYEDYIMHGGELHPQGNIRYGYFPETCPELPQKLARLSRGTEAGALAFVQTYGLLGYAQFCSAAGRNTPDRAPGEPLTWVLAHAETVAWCLRLTYALQTSDDEAIQCAIRAFEVPKPAGKVARHALRLPAIREQLHVPFRWIYALDSLHDWQRYARALRREVINVHLTGITLKLIDMGETDVAGFEFHALLEMIYWHLRQIVTGEIVQRCADATCGAFFVQTRQGQRFCPHDDPTKESPCAVRVRMRDWRKRNPHSG